MSNLSYQLVQNKKEQSPLGAFKEFIKNTKELYAYIQGDGTTLSIAFLMVCLNSVAGVVTPFFIAYAIDSYISKGNSTGLLSVVLGLALLYIATVATGYIQGRLMGTVAQKTLFRLRTALFAQLQELPITFFNQNKAGDLISRINNDTDKLNQFLSESILRLFGNFFVVFGIAIFVLFLHLQLALAMLSVIIILVLITRLLSPWIEKENSKSLYAFGQLSASLQENITNFRAIAVYGRRDYFTSHITSTNKEVFTTTLKAGAANRIFEPIYDLAGSIAFIVVIAYGTFLIGQGQLTIGLLIAFLSYTQKLYDPLRILATIFGSIQQSIAAWSRVQDIFRMKNNMPVIQSDITSSSSACIEFKHVSFKFEDSDMILENVELTFAPGKTYALVGPTGGGKSTLANLMSRLYDATSGTIFFNGKDIRTYTPSERAQKIGVILQDPILFPGTVADNIRYGNEMLRDMSDTAVEHLLLQKGLEEVIGRFNQGLATSINQNSGLSIGQKQLVSFMRAIIREPELLILDEATANIDTITERILEKALETLPSHTTKVIIAHRLNTVKQADEILFVNGRRVVRAEDVDRAIDLINDARRTS